MIGKPGKFQVVLGENIEILVRYSTFIRTFTRKIPKYYDIDNRTQKRKYQYFTPSYFHHMGVRSNLPL